MPCLQDNYAWLLRDEASGKVAVVDPSEGDKVHAALQARGWRLDYIFNTHHHWDHVGGNTMLKSKYGCSVVGAARDKHRIPGIDVQLVEG